MASFLSVIPHVIVMSAEFITGFTVNGFLILINCKELIKSRKLTPMQLLFLCIGMSRFGLLMVLMVQSFFSVFFPLFYRVKVYGAAMLFFWMFFSSVSLWFATCLSVFYCLKISGFTQSYFLWLKFRISKLMSWLLLGSFLASMSTAALCIEADYPKDTNDDDVLKNATLKRTEPKIRQINGVLLVNLALLFPLALFVMCTFMLLISLYKHTHRMQNGSHGVRNASTEAHINALKTVMTFFCFFISYFAAFMANMTFSIPYRSHCFFVLKNIMAAFPSGHSIIIILSNSKFQQPFRRLLCLKKNQ
ncbi:taste receptor type 2 member 7-like [Enhydra lutris kenyoni]|uniref:Taste receptor type 2 n=1 Tax=Enhydra lutris kenyoni TaxID=391180 RepID=A0A2Y9JGJ1_ENHLU|nr:taste receptor type 2 member 7-like [Enhydra lutris kenyoni]